MSFSGVTTIDKSDVHAKGQGQSSKVVIAEIKTNFALNWAFPDRNIGLNAHMAT